MEANKVSKAENKVYCLTEGGLFYYDTKDNSINKVSKENGLSDSEISTIAYSDNEKILIIAYKSGNIDLIQNNRIYNISHIKNKVMPGDKRIYNIFIDGAKGYLACGFGIVILNLSKREISETYLIKEGIPLKINEISMDDQFIYAATDEGIYFAQKNSSNLLDYKSWIIDVTIPNFNKKFNTITCISGKIYTNYSSGINGGDKVYYKEGNTWKQYMFFNNDNCNQLTGWLDYLMIAGNFHVDVYDSNGVNLRHVFFGNPRCAIRDEEGILWVADGLSGLIRNKDDTPLLKLSPDGPAHIFVSDIKIQDDILYAVPGGQDPGQGNLYRAAEIYTFRNNSWSNWKSDSIRDFYRIAIDPDDSRHYYISSWGYGLFEYFDGVLNKIYRNDNSTLQTIIPGEMYYRLGGLIFDRGKNLWITNSGVSEPVSVLKRNGSWKGFSLNNMISSNPGDIIETKDGLKWIILTGGKGLFVIDDNRTIDNEDDDIYKKIDIVDENNRIISNEIFSFAEDRVGNLWLGTNKGILVYYNPSGVLNSDNFYAKPIIVPRNDGSNAGDLLLGTETVTCIEVDGANRKWLGTRNAGVFLVSDDGLKQIYNFNADNSPLLSNSIYDIAINGKNGEVFFGTEKGIISFKSSATEPAETFDNIYVYPNPVREDFAGDVVIAGLAENTLIKITDLNGNLVYETTSLGGQALWNGRNSLGKRVSTGVYLIFCSNKDNTITHITKVLFIH